MSTITPQEILNQWKLEQIPVEMAMGHVLQNLIQQQTILDSLTLTVSKLSAQSGNLLPHTNSLSVEKTNRKTRS